MTPDVRRAEAGPPDLEVLVAPNPGPLTLEGTCSYLLGRSGLVLVDPGPELPGQVERLVEAVRRRRACVKAVCLTHAHPDHAGCARRAAEALSAPVAASGETLERLGLAGLALADQDVVDVDGGESTLRALRTPGHSKDHLAYLWLPRRWILTGDLVLGRGTSVVVHPDGRVGSYLASLARLIALRPERLLPGHGPAVKNAVDKLEEYGRHRRLRDRQILRAVREEGARTLAEIRSSVYGELPTELVQPAELSILAHLEHLRQTGHDLPEGIASGTAGGAVP